MIFFSVGRDGVTIGGIVTPFPEPFKNGEHP